MIHYYSLIINNNTTTTTSSNNKIKQNKTKQTKKMKREINTHRIRARKAKIIIIIKWKRPTTNKTLKKSKIKK